MQDVYDQQNCFDSSLLFNGEKICNLKQKGRNVLGSRHLHMATVGACLGVKEDQRSKEWPGKPVASDGDQLNLWPHTS